MSHARSIITKAANYAEEERRLITIDIYDAQKNAYFVNVKTEYILCNSLRDAFSPHQFKFEIIPDPFEGREIKELGRVYSINVGGHEHIIKPEIISHTAGFQTQLSIDVPASGRIKVLYEHSMWYEVGEKQISYPQRFVNNFVLEFINRSEHTPIVEIESDGRGAISLLFNSTTMGVDLEGVRPQEQAYSFILRPPPA